MSKMSELSQVLDDMIACGEGMIRAANAIKEIFSSTEEKPAKEMTTAAKASAPEPETEKEPAEAPAPTYTKEDVRAVLAAKSSAGFRKEVKDLLAKYGAQQLKQVSPDDYAALLQEAEVIGNA
jgi:hypothetical protein